MFSIYTDGSCLQRPGELRSRPGGYGAIITHPDHGSLELLGGHSDTTNNRMELQAVIEALSLVPDGSQVLVRTDSQYIAKAFNDKWLDNWSKRNYRNVKNEGLWKVLDKERRRIWLTFEWVKGHSDDILNTRADALAREGTDRACVGVYQLQYQCTKRWLESGQRQPVGEYRGRCHDWRSRV